MEMIFYGCSSEYGGLCTFAPRHQMKVVICLVEICSAPQTAGPSAAALGALESAHTVVAQCCCCMS